LSFRVPHPFTVLAKRAAFSLTNLNDNVTSKTDGESQTIT